MPLYEYFCAACEQKGEYLLKIDAPAPDACRFCGKGPLQKKVSQSAFVLKGEGWYVTDFRDKNKKSTPASTDKEQNTSDSPKTESKDAGSAASESTTKETAKTDVPKKDAPAKQNQASAKE